MQWFGGLVRSYRKKLHFSQAYLAEMFSLSEQTLYRIEKGTPVSRKTMELVFEGMRQPVFSCYLDPFLRNACTEKSELVRRLLASMRHHNNDLYYSLLSKYFSLEIPDNPITAQYDAFFTAYRMYLEGAKPRHICLSLLEALCLTIDVHSLLKEICLINKDLDKSRIQTRDECRLKMAEYFSPVLTEPELLIINALSCILYHLKDYKGAICILDALITHLETEMPKMPGWDYYVPTVYYNKAVCLMKQEFHEDALSTIEKLLSFENTYEDDLVCALSDNLQLICKNSDTDKSPSLLPAYFRPTSYWSVIIMATFLETNTLDNLKPPKKSSLR